MLDLYGEIVASGLLYLNFIERAREYNNFREVLNKRRALVELGYQGSGDGLLLLCCRLDLCACLGNLLLQSCGLRLQLVELLFCRLALGASRFFCRTSKQLLVMGIVFGENASGILGLFCLG